MGLPRVGHDLASEPDHKVQQPLWQLGLRRGVGAVHTAQQTAVMSSALHADSFPADNETTPNSLLHANLQRFPGARPEPDLLPPVRAAERTIGSAGEGLGVGAAGRSVLGVSLLPLPSYVLGRESRTGLRGDSGGTAPARQALPPAVQGW